MERQRDEHRGLADEVDAWPTSEGARGLCVMVTKTVATALNSLECIGTASGLCDGYVERGFGTRQVVAAGTGDPFGVDVTFELAIQTIM